MHIGRSLLALLVLLVTVCGCTTGSQHSKVLSRHPHNPTCFLYEGKPFRILTSAEHYGAVLNADFNYEVYLDEMKRTGENGTRVFTFYRETPKTIGAMGSTNTLPDCSPIKSRPSHL